MCSFLKVIIRVHVITLYICVLVHCLPQLECKSVMKVAALFALFIAVRAVLRMASSKCLTNIYWMNEWDASEIVYYFHYHLHLFMAYDYFEILLKSLPTSHTPLTSTKHTGILPLINDIIVPGKIKIIKAVVQREKMDFLNYSCRFARCKPFWVSEVKPWRNHVKVCGKRIEEESFYPIMET